MNGQVSGAGGGWIDPFVFVKAAIEAVPAVKYAFGVGGIEGVISLVDGLIRPKVLAGCVAGVLCSQARRHRVFGFLVAGTLFPFAALAQTNNCRVTHIDFHQRRALQSVEALLRAPYVLSPYPYVPASSAQRKPGESEAARIVPDVVAQDPDVVIVHGSTFTGSANLRLALGELIRSVDLATGDIRGFVVYSSAPLDTAALSIEGPLRSKLQFMYAPIVNRFRPPDPSAEVLKSLVKRLCGI